MDRDTILNAWATIATPYKKKKPYIEREVKGKRRIRQVSGNKGLGRLIILKKVILILLNLMIL